MVVCMMVLLATVEASCCCFLCVNPDPDSGFEKSQEWMMVLSVGVPMATKPYSLKKMPFCLHYVGSVPSGLF